MLFRFLTISLWAATFAGTIAAAVPARPNILIVISDDQSFAHTSMAGYPGVSTPHFDRVAGEGVHFVNAIAASPGCSPSRAALLTGRHTWQIEQAGTHASSFPGHYRTFMELLQESGYVTGFTGKGWSPGNFRIGGRTENPAGPEFGGRTLVPPAKGMSPIDYAGNFGDFMAQRDAAKPFAFWFGTKEPHRQYEAGSGIRSGKNLADTPPPPFLPDVVEVRSDMADYCLEIEWFDAQLGLALAQLEAAGELDNTIVIVTGDNGMPFPRAKANVYEYGIHVPLAVRWGAAVPAGRTILDVVGFVDLTATILDAAHVSPDPENPLSGRSLLPVLTSTADGVIDPNAAAYAARERHSSSRFANLAYPQRALRTGQYLFVRNFRPQRWPAGDPVLLDESGDALGPHSGYKDIDASPSLDVLIAGADVTAITDYFHLAVAKRPAEELFDIQQDPGCLNNLAADPAFQEISARLRERLMRYLGETGDPRVLNGGEIWETYPRYSPIRAFPAPVAPGKDY